MPSLRARGDARYACFVHPAVRGALAAGLVLAGAPARAEETAAVEVRVAMPGPDRALVEVRLAPGHPFAEAEAYSRLTADPGGGWRAEEPAPRRSGDGAALFQSEIRVSQDGWVRVGVPLPTEAPSVDADFSFRAVVRPPAGYRVVDPFPSRVEEGEDGAVHLELPAPPSLLRFRVVPEGTRGFSAAAAADLVVALVLGALAAFGLARLRRPVGDSAS